MNSVIRDFSVCVDKQDPYGINRFEYAVYADLPPGHRLHGWSCKKINDLVGIISVEGPSLIDGILYDTVPELFYKLTYSQNHFNGYWRIGFHTAQRASETPFLTETDVTNELNKLVDWLASMN